MTKIIPGFNEMYSVDSTGSVISHYKNITLKLTNNGRGYFNVKLMTQLKPVKKYKTLYIHRLVAQAFIPNPENKPQVNHIDGNKANNDVSNLEWTTAKENMEHASTTGLVNTNCSKATEEELIQIIKEFLKGNTTLIEVQHRLNYQHKNSLVKVLRKRTNNVALFDKLVLKEAHNSRFNNRLTKASYKVTGTHKQTGETVIFNSLTEAAKYVKATASMLQEVINGNNKKYNSRTSKGYYWNKTI